MHTPQTQIYSYGPTEMSTVGIFRGRNVQAIRSVAEMSLAEMSEHRSHSVAVTIGNCRHKVKVFDILLGWGVGTQMTSTYRRKKVCAPVICSHAQAGQMDC